MAQFLKNLLAKNTTAFNVMFEQSEVLVITGKYRRPLCCGTGDPLQRHSLERL